MENDILEVAVRAYVDTYTSRTLDETPDEDYLKSMVVKAARELKGRLEMPPEQLNQIVTAAMTRGSYAANVEYSRHTVARWFEIPLDEFDAVPAETLTGRSEVFFRHAYYERLLEDWLKEWGYTVETGKELEGLGGTEFVSDVYGTLDTLHGQFQVVASLFCDSIQMHYRTLAALESMEAFAPKGSDNEFSHGDIHLLVTPFKFPAQADRFMRVQASQESYYVVPVEGNDLQDLDNASDPASRKERMQELVAAVARVKEP